MTTIHPKVKWGAVAAAAATAAIAISAACGVTLPGGVDALLTALAGLAGGYTAKSPSADAF